MSSKTSSPAKSTMKITPSGADRREFRRHDLEHQGIPIDRWDGGRRVGKNFGKIVDISAGGVRIRTSEPIKQDHQIRVRLDLPAYAGICPFIKADGSSLAP